MFRRTWWTRRRIIEASVFGAVAILAAIWLSGSETIEEGQSWEVANSNVLKMGGEDVTNYSGRASTIGAYTGPIPVVKDAYFNMPDGSVLIFRGYAKSETDTLRVDSIRLARDGIRFWNKDGFVEEESHRQFTRHHSPLYPLRLLQWNWYGSKR